MRVFKFGGASVKNPNAVRNVKRVLELFPQEDLVVVISAMGKTTNKLEWLVNAHVHNKGLLRETMQELVDFHNEILWDLFPDRGHEVYVQMNEYFYQIEEILEDVPGDHYDFIYDQIVSYGEVISTTIVSAFLNDFGIENNWLDARKLIRTDNTYREGRVNWEKTASKINQAILPNLNTSKRTVFITQGFIGHTPEGLTTTLGREGSDYTAGIFAYCLEAQDVTIWKDVPGMLNADPKWFDDTVKLDKISYHEAIELSYFGASVIHPKTIKPLQNKEIPLYVKSFVQPEESGTVIQASMENDALVPSFIFKMSQVLISISPKDFSFIVEHNLSEIFEIFHRHGVKINLMQNSAISFSVSVDGDERKVPRLIEELAQTYHIKYNEGLELVTIRHYDQATIERVTMNKELLVVQKSRHTSRMVMRDLGESKMSE